MLGNEDLLYSTDSSKLNKKRGKRQLTIMEEQNMKEILMAHILPGFLRYSFPASSGNPSWLPQVFLPGFLR